MSLKSDHPDKPETVSIVDRVAQIVKQRPLHIEGEKFGFGPASNYFKVGGRIALFDATVEAAREAWDSLTSVAIRRIKDKDGEMLEYDLRSVYRSVGHPGPWNRTTLIGNNHTHPLLATGSSAAPS